MLKSNIMFSEGSPPGFSRNSSFGVGNLPVLGASSAANGSPPYANATLFAVLWARMKVRPPPPSLHACCMLVVIPYATRFFLCIKTERFTLRSNRFPCRGCRLLVSSAVSSFTWDVGCPSKVIPVVTIAPALLLAVAGEPHQVSETHRGARCQGYNFQPGVEFSYLPLRMVPGLVPRSFITRTTLCPSVCAYLSCSRMAWWFGTPCLARSMPGMHMAEGPLSACLYSCVFQSVWQYRKFRTFHGFPP